MKLGRWQVENRLVWVVGGGILMVFSVFLGVGAVKLNNDTRNRAASCTVGRIGTCGTCCDGSLCYRERDAACNVTNTCETTNCGGLGGGWWIQGMYRR